MQSSRLGKSAQAACQFPACGLKKRVLTVKGSGCVPSGHPARPPPWLPKYDGSQADAAFEPLRRVRRADAMLGRKASADALKEQGSRSLRARRVPAATYRCRSGVADTVSIERNRGGAQRCRLTAVWSSCSRRKQVRSDSVRRRSCDARRPRADPFAALGFPIRSLHRQMGGAPSSVAACGAERAARRPLRDFQMANKMLIDATHPEETRVVVLRGNRVEEFDFESAQRKQLRGNIYLAKVTRVEPSLQAAFVDYGGNRHGFLAFSEIHPDYYQIPVADRQALIDEDERAQRAADDEVDRRSRRHRGRGRPSAAGATTKSCTASRPKPPPAKRPRPSQIATTADARRSADHRPAERRRRGGRSPPNRRAAGRCRRQRRRSAADAHGDRSPANRRRDAARPADEAARWSRAEAAAPRPMRRPNPMQPRPAAEADNGGEAGHAAAEDKTAAAETAEAEMTRERRRRRSRGRNRRIGRRR